jgi:hypothetical protein
VETAVVVALITAVGGVLAALVTKGRQENKDDHASVMRGIERIEGKIDGHINDHAQAGMK